MHAKILPSPAGLYRGLIGILGTGSRAEHISRRIDLKEFQITDVLHTEFNRYVGQDDVSLRELPQIVGRMKELHGSTEPIGVALATLGEETTLVEHPYLQGIREKQFIEYEVQQQLSPEKLRTTEWRTLSLKRSHNEGVSRTVFCKASHVAVSNLLNSLKENLTGRLDYATTRPFTSMDLVSLAERVTPTDSEELVAIIEMHATHSEIQFFGNGTYFRRVIPFGTTLLIDNVANIMNCSKEESEKLITLVISGGASYPSISAVLLALGEQFERKVNQNFSFISTLMNGASVQKVILIGQALQITGLAARLKSQLSQDVVYGASAFGLEGFLGADGNVLCTHHDSFNALVAAIHRLGFGLHRANFLPNGNPFGPDVNAAWGVSVGASGITAIRVVRNV
jgi:hypothetical protein